MLASVTSRSVLFAEEPQRGFADRTQPFDVDPSHEWPDAPHTDSDEDERNATHRAEDRGGQRKTQQDQEAANHESEQSHNDDVETPF